jgi:hypothetical protein
MISKQRPLAFSGKTPVDHDPFPVFMYFEPNTQHDESRNWLSGIKGKTLIALLPSVVAKDVTHIASHFMPAAVADQHSIVSCNF